MIPREELRLYRIVRWPSARTKKTIAANTLAAISRNQVRGPKPRDAAFGGDAARGLLRDAARPGDLSSVFARFRFLAKAISEAEIGRAQRQERRTPRRFYDLGSGAPTASAIRPAQCSRLPS